VNPKSKFSVLTYMSGPQKERSEMAENILAARHEINVVVTTYDMAAKKEDNKFMRKLKPDVSINPFLVLNDIY
jgi:hypothetical protein